MSLGAVVDSPVVAAVDGLDWERLRLPELRGAACGYLPTLAGGWISFFSLPLAANVPERWQACWQKLAVGEATRLRLQLGWQCDPLHLESPSFVSRLPVASERPLSAVHYLTIETAPGSDASLSPQKLLVRHLDRLAAVPGLLGASVRLLNAVESLRLLRWSMNPEYTPAGWSPQFAETTTESPWQQCFKRELTEADAANVQLDEPPLAIWQTLLEPDAVSKMSSPFAWATEGMAYRCLLSQQQDAPHAELITVCEEGTTGETLEMPPEWPAVLALFGPTQRLPAHRLATFVKSIPGYGA